MSALPISLGDREDGFKLELGLERLPNLLIGGARGQGKTVMLNQIITSLATKLTPEEVRFVLYDPYLRRVHDVFRFAAPSSAGHQFAPEDGS